MDFEQDEEKIRKALEAYRLRKPPQEMMRDYEKEVLRKIKVSASRPMLEGTGIAMALGLALMLAGAGLFFWEQRKDVPAPETVTVIPESYVVIPAKAGIHVSGSPIKDFGDDRRHRGNDNVTFAEDMSPQEEEAVFKELARELFILEALGEDEGLLDDVERLKADLEIMGVGLA